MSGINFLDSNLMDSATLTIDTGTANAQFPISNLQIETTTRKFRSVGNSIIFIVDTLTFNPADTIAVVGDATNTLGITSMTFRSSLTLDFTSSTPQAIDISAEHNIGFLFFTEVNHRYFEITLTGTGTYAEISNLFVGKRTNLPFNSLSVDTFRYKNNDRSDVRTNEYGQRFIDERKLTKEIRGAIEFTNQTEMDALDNIINAHGRHKPFWVVVDPNSDAVIDGKYKFSMYSYLRRMPTWSAAGGKHYTARFGLIQVV